MFTFGHQGRQLIAKALASPRGHHQDAVGGGHGGVDAGELLRPQGGKAELVAESREYVAAPWMICSQKE